MSDKPKGLIEFAQGDRIDCAWLAKHEVWPEIVEGYHAGVSTRTIRNWLVRERGFTDKQLPSQDLLGRYLRNNYPRDDA